MANKKKKLDTSILDLGQRKIQTPLKNICYAEDSKPLPVVMNEEELPVKNRAFLSLKFEKAGPREKLYFDPSKTKCAIVTCGGLSPGINDVIRSIVMEAHYHYGTRSYIIATISHYATIITPSQSYIDKRHSDPGLFVFKIYLTFKNNTCHSHKAIQTAIP